MSFPSIHKPHKPYYPHNPIASVEALARTLGIQSELLKQFANDRVQDSYISFSIFSKSKPDKERFVHSPKFELKKIQKRINSKIFEEVKYPYYLYGGIKDEKNPRDYVKNAIHHAQANQIICVDVKNFYHNIKYEYVEKVFKYFFKFPADVSEILAKLITYKGRVPQGGCTSSYIANLIFFDTEYSFVSNLEKKNVRYSRLLDDITLSTDSHFTKNEESAYVTSIANMLKKYELQLNGKKTKIEHRSNPNVDFEITGLWIGHKIPKCRKKERHLIRRLVYLCEKNFKINPYSDEYHDRWNETSGKVAQIERLNHIQAKKLRNRLSLILPLYDEAMEKKITHNVKKMISLTNSQRKKIQNVKLINKLIHSLGILSRTNRLLAKSLRLQINSVYFDKTTNKNLWGEES